MTRSATREDVRTAARRLAILAGPVTAGGGLAKVSRSADCRGGLTRLAAARNRVARLTVTFGATVLRITLEVETKCSSARVVELVLAEAGCKRKRRCQRKPRSQRSGDDEQ